MWKKTTIVVIFDFFFYYKEKFITILYWRRLISVRRHPPAKATTFSCFPTSTGRELQPPYPLFFTDHFLECFKLDPFQLSDNNIETNTVSNHWTNLITKSLNKPIIESQPTKAARSSQFNVYSSSECQTT